MTFGDALHRFPTSADRSILRDGVDGVLTAGRMETALTAEQSTERGAIKNHEEDAKTLWDRHGAYLGFFFCQVL
jgi:hypothetical protein